MISSRRFRNSGRSVWRTISITSSRISSVMKGLSRYCEPRLLVRMMTVSLNDVDPALRVGSAGPLP